MRLFIEIFKLCVTVDRSGSTKLEKMIKEKSFLLLLSATSTRMDPRIEERQLNFFLFPGFVPPFSLKAKIALVIWRPFGRNEKGPLSCDDSVWLFTRPFQKSPDAPFHSLESLDSKFDAFRNGKNIV